MDINKYIFSRTKAPEKIKTIEEMNDRDLLKVTKDTLMKIVTKAGEGDSKIKTLYIKDSKGNNWNSSVNSIYTYKHNLYIDCYLQYSNTDTNVQEIYEKFFCNGTYHGSTERYDSYGNSRTFYFNYDEDEKAAVIKSILLQYIYNCNTEKPS